jgi:choline-glycine betaine transporter
VYSHLPALLLCEFHVLSAHDGMQHFWLLFLLYVAYKYGNLKLGKPGDVPEYPTLSWFMMMFSAGLGVGLFFYGVAEPILHYEPCGGNPGAGRDSLCHGNRFAHMEDDERAQWAVVMAYFHWGFHGWAVYVVVALSLATVVYRACDSCLLLCCKQARYHSSMHLHLAHQTCGGLA